MLRGIASKHPVKSCIAKREITGPFAALRVTRARNVLTVILTPKAEGSSNGTSKFLIAVDGNLKIDKMPQDIQMPIVKGDGRIASISAASILAKVFRDRYMDKLEELYPGYGFDKHAGYGTKAHLDAIRRQGFTPAHRKSFHPKSL